MAAENSEDVRTTCFAQGADGFICKRRLYPDLRREIAEVFQGPAIDGPQEAKHVT